MRELKKNNKVIYNCFSEVFDNVGYMKLRWISWYYRILVICYVYE